MKRASFLVVAVAAISVPRVALAVPEDPGPLTSVKQTYDVPVGANITLGTDVFLPGNAMRAPLVVLRHGYLSTRGTLTGWGTHLASHGYVTVVFDSRDNTTDDPQTDGADMASVTQWVVAQSGDASSPLAGRVDPTRIAVGGHSAGGAAAVVAASGLSHVQAIVLLDSEDTAPSLAAAAALSIPTVGIFGAPSSCNENGDNRKTYVAVKGPHLGIYVKGASHCDAENPADSLCEVACGSTDAARGAAFRRYATAFLETYLSCDASAFPYLGGAAAASDTSVSILPATGAIVLPPPSCGGDGGAGDDGGSGSGPASGGASSGGAPDASAGGANGDGAGPSGDSNVGSSGCAAAPARVEDLLTPLALGAALLVIARRRRTMR